MYISKECENRTCNHEISELTKQLESLESWLVNNTQHVDFEKVNRKRNALNAKITAKQQYLERQKYPARFQGGSLEYNLTTNIR